MNEANVAPKNLSTFDKFKDAFNCFPRPSFKTFCLAKNNSQTSLHQPIGPASHLSSRGSEKCFRSRRTHTGELLSRCSEQKYLFQPLEVKRFDPKIFQMKTNYGVTLYKKTSSSKYECKNPSRKKQKRAYELTKDSSQNEKYSADLKEDEENVSMDYYASSCSKQQIVDNHQDQLEEKGKIRNKLSIHSSYEDKIEVHQGSEMEIEPKENISKIYFNSLQNETTENEKQLQKKQKDSFNAKKSYLKDVQNQFLLVESDYSYVKDSDDDVNSEDNMDLNNADFMGTLAAELVHHVKVANNKLTSKQPSNKEKRKKKVRHRTPFATISENLDYFAGVSRSFSDNLEILEVCCSDSIIEETNLCAQRSASGTMIDSIFPIKEEMYGEFGNLAGIDVIDPADQSECLDKIVKWCKRIISERDHEEESEIANEIDVEAVCLLLQNVSSASKQSSVVKPSTIQIVESTTKSTKVPQKRSSVFRVPKLSSYVSSETLLQKKISKRHSSVNRGDLEDHKVSLIKKIRKFMNRQRELELKPTKSYSRCDFGPPEEVPSLNRKFNYKIHKCANCFGDDSNIFNTNNSNSCELDLRDSRLKLTSHSHLSKRIKKKIFKSKNLFIRRKVISMRRIQLLLIFKFKDYLLKIYVNNTPYLTQQFIYNPNGFKLILTRYLFVKILPIKLREISANIKILKNNSSLKKKLSIQLCAV